MNGDILAVHDGEHNSKLETYLTGLHDGSQYTTTIPPSYTYTSAQAVCVFDEEAGVFWVALAPKDKDGVVYDQLSTKDKAKFDASRFKEIGNRLKMGAVSVMSLKESNYYRMNLSEHIILSNMLDKWKLQDDGTMLAKSRNVLIGWKDPMIYQLERSAPTPTQEGIMVM